MCIQLSVALFQGKLFIKYGTGHEKRVILHPMSWISAYAGTDIQGSPQKFVTSVCSVPGSHLCKHWETNCYLSPNSLVRFRHTLMYIRIIIIRDKKIISAKVF